MVERLILGWAPSPWVLVEFARRTTGGLMLVAQDEELTDLLRDEGIDVVRADPADAAALREVDRADAILIAAREGERNCAVAAAARTVFPDARLIAYSGSGLTPAMRGRLDRLADHVIDHVTEVGTEVVHTATSAPAVRSHRVRTMLDGVDGPLCVFMHDNPDPDALASAIALVRIAEDRGNAATAYYFGEITHQSNRAFINLLDLPAVALDPGTDLPPCEAIALVDHALPGVNDSLPPDLTPDLIFDHHTPSGPVEGRYVDLRESVGATSSIMVEYLRQLEVDIDKDLATALLNGIRTDTKNFARKVSPVDFRAAGFLWELADHTALERIEQSSLSNETLATIGDAIDARTVRGPVLSTCVGRVGTRDALAQAADLLLQMEGVELLLVYGVKDDVIYASARARPTMGGIDLAAIMREAFGAIGTAGGHEEMAGAQIPVGMLAAIEGEQEMRAIDVVREVIDGRFFETVEDWLRPDIGFDGYVSE